MMITITGKSFDLTHNPPQSINAISVKTFTTRDDGSGGLLTSTPEMVDFDRETGTITISGLSGGLSWLSLEGEGWSRSIPLAVKKGTTTLIEAVANAASPEYPLGRGETEVISAETKAELTGLVEQARIYADAASRSNVAEAVYFKGALRVAVDILSLAPGRYTIYSRSVSKAMGLPGGDTGELRISYLDGPNGRLYGRFEWEDSSAHSVSIWRAMSYNGRLHKWFEMNPPYVRPALSLASVLTDLTPGKYPVLSEDVAQALGLPWHGRGMVTIDWLGNSAYQCVDWVTGMRPMFHYRMSIYNKSTKNAVWEVLHGKDEDSDPNASTTALNKVAMGAALDMMFTVSDPTSDYESTHAELLKKLVSAVGETQVEDKGAIALVYDHGTTAFRDWLWPELKKRNLPATLALCPEVHLDGNGDSRHQASNDEIRDWIKDGLDIACHSGDHSGAPTLVDIFRQIVVAKSTLQTKLETDVFSWVQPGYHLESGDYGGFGSGNSADKYTNTVTGRLLQKTYPVITGYVGDKYTYPMEPLPVGVQRSLIEGNGSIASAKQLIESVIATHSKHIVFSHPYAIGWSGLVSQADYVEFLDWLVEKRSAGELEILTLSKLAIATK